VIAEATCPESPRSQHAALARVCLSADPWHPRSPSCIGLRQMFCRRCKYPLHAVREHRCPECAKQFDPGRSSTFLTDSDQPSDRQNRWMIGGLLAAMFIAVVVVLGVLLLLALGIDGALSR
jgi:hypothetical protein